MHAEKIFYRQQLTNLLSCITHMLELAVNKDHGDKFEVRYDFEYHAFLDYIHILIGAFFEFDLKTFEETGKIKRKKHAHKEDYCFFEFCNHYNRDCSEKIRNKMTIIKKRIEYRNKHVGHFTSKPRAQTFFLREMPDSVILIYELLSPIINEHINDEETKKVNNRYILFNDLFTKANKKYPKKGI